MTNLKIYISPVKEKLETVGQQFNIIRRVSLGTPPQALVMSSLTHNHDVIS